MSSLIFGLYYDSWLEDSKYLSSINTEHPAYERASRRIKFARECKWDYLSSFNWDFMELMSLLNHDKFIGLFPLLEELIGFNPIP